MNGLSNQSSDSSMSIRNADRLFRKFQRRNRLLAAYRRELLEKLVQRVACLEIIEELYTGTRVPTNTSSPPMIAGSLCTICSFTITCVFYVPESSQCGTGESLLPEASCHVVAHVFPRFARGFTGQDATASPLDLPRPGILNRGRVLSGIVEAGQQFRGNIGVFIDGQRQCFPE
jgi:hypothetical protein